ncbi:YkoF family thiamine/hydroxymethylpyrimidine-binding protein [Catenovulum sediminis]|uniref:YkoF family thiamine/hydroxymethylpyrimidine-binding protein n=1 Tax=Catenovulum sediminis TaxID=1740262 RepID=A0ABV1REU7_9ALTE|nr:YkoF family thiamine/hydroxymethylpyrimidine-binding protein [Catenovulum sediminis]
MQLSVEISLYPLAQQQFETAIWDFIERVKQTPNVRITTNGMSSQVFGAYDDVMQCLQKEFKITYQQTGTAIFVCKFVPGDRSTLNE